MEPLELNGWLWLIWCTCWFAAAAFANRSKSQETILQRQKHTLPTVVAFALIFFTRRWINTTLFTSEKLQLIGLGVTAAGLLFTFWARIHLGKYWSGIITLKVGHKLIRTGPYAYVRHPIYTGFLIASVGSFLCAQSGDALLGVALMLAIYYFKARREEAILITEFGDEYKRYIEEVPMLMPVLN